jgi:hypothetical protein
MRSRSRPVDVGANHAEHFAPVIAESSLYEVVMFAMRLKSTLPAPPVHNLDGD